MSQVPYKWLKSLKIKSLLVREFLAELLGTFILIMFGDSAFGTYVLNREEPVDVFAITFAWGVGVILGISLAGGLTGGHINPAVTLALATLGKLPWKKVPVYILGQYIGAFLASALIFFNLREGLNLYSGDDRFITGVNGTGFIWTTYPRSGISMGTIFLDNLIGTGMLVFTAMAIIDKRNMKIPAYLHPIFIGLMITACAISFGFNCMAPLNPARDFAPRLLTAMAGWGAEPFRPMGFHYWWVAGIVSPHIGGIIGAWLYYLGVELHWPDDEVEAIEKDGKEHMPNGKDGREQESPNKSGWKPVPTSEEFPMSEKC